ncbi:hypothetical protein EB796_019238 [Bugula neritina]|uniref:Uncharacterized protein n=1 Tax=Bugula neritina TaxID=10212 RepID=A0A7J7J9P8_BUGNE|nr:hypothetical protein EB796_019238 [Bugula neritina]
MAFKRPKFEKDKGYAWVILFFSFLSHFVHIGFSFGTAGNLTIAHQEFFKVNLQKGSLIGSVYLGVLFLFGPIASILVKKLGCRFTEILGGFLFMLGLGVSVFSQDLWHAIILYGVVAGIGASCCYTASSQILAIYFDKLKYLAFSLATLGIYIGLMTWPILCQFLLNKFGYSHAMGIMACAHLLHIIAGISFFEPAEKGLEGTTDKPDNVTSVTSDEPKEKIDESLGKDNFAMEVNMVI